MKVEIIIPTNIVTIVVHPSAYFTIVYPSGLGMIFSPLSICFVASVMCDCFIECKVTKKPAQTSGIFQFLRSTLLSVGPSTGSGASVYSIVQVEPLFSRSSMLWIFEAAFSFSMTCTRLSLKVGAFTSRMTPMATGK